MSTELFEAVHAAETKAEDIMLEAQRGARELIKETETFCLENERAKTREHHAHYQSLLEEKRRAIQLELGEETSKALLGIEQEMQIAHEKLPQAVRRIAERVMCDGNR